MVIKLIHLHLLHEPNPVVLINVHTRGYVAWVEAASSDSEDLVIIADNNQLWKSQWGLQDHKA